MNFTIHLILNDVIVIVRGLFIFVVTNGSEKPLNHTMKNKVYRIFDNRIGRLA